MTKKSSSVPDDDVELHAVPTSHLANDVIDHFSWRDVRVVVKDRQSGSPLAILSEAAGIVHAGEMLALMGPSGSGKTTLLNALAHRPAAAGATTTGQILANGERTTASILRDVSAYVEQEDALTGSITVRETMIFAARLALPSSVSRREAFRRVDDLITSFGLQSQAHTIVGTPIKKGLSGGQKKRLGVASRLVTSPHILFLDEPTSGLDSALSAEVIRYIKEIGKRNNLIIISSIHQPSTSTYQMFDKLALLSLGKTCYFGPVHEAPAYFARIGYPMAPATNPAEFLLDLINIDLDRDGEVQARTKNIQDLWLASPERRALDDALDRATASRGNGRISLAKLKVPKPRPWMVPLTLLHRAWIKSYRDVVAYEIRVVMYLGLAVLMGTVFLRLKTSQEYIQPFINAIFFGGAFMSFMAVAYVPAFLEDLHTFQRERANGLVGPFSFLLANFVIGLPFLFLIAVLFSVVEYWLSNFRADGAAFMTWVLWLFLDLLAAESLVVLVSSLFPVFVVALAIAAFANGLWMTVNGFLVPLSLLNVFWKYVFHYIDYQAYVFQGMMVNEFKARDFTCAPAPGGSGGGGGGGGYQCMYAGDRNAEGIIQGTDVLRAFNIETGLEGEWIGISVGIIVAYRLLAYLALRFLRK
ncbi:ATP-binding cassette sub-family G member 5 [Niveomyces insectorum RCEF 264]|uniref:ATP-binding cassette sub-family G member 5 n=1 Tax=Niveomyces insectorum RCEF 264 TaxID=1081102 RepID=A0A162MRH1_9HYPO|nr:ATP-binding cassette sub-family G member 5 [Niveomyces insectorum RCEF 264]